MKYSELKTALVYAFERTGFSKNGKGLSRTGSGVVTVVNFNRGFGNQLFVDVGFWLSELGQQIPRLTQHTHMYFRLERLVPELGTVILTAGDLDDPSQDEALGKLLQAMPMQVDSRLRQLASTSSLAAEFSTLQGLGIVTKEARDRLAP